MESVIGRIMRGVGGFYDVRLQGGDIIRCRARGHFRNDGMSPVVGDLVQIARLSDGTGSLDKILPRKNLLVRPCAANIDRLVIVIAASAPRPDWLLIDKLLIQAFLLFIEPLLVLNKLDECDDAIVETFRTDYEPAFDTLRVSVVSGLGIDALKLRLFDAVSCFAGQSAVGKTSLLNALLPTLALPTGGLSQKTERGRHTTRKAELWPYGNGAILDTPGFSLFDSPAPDQEALDKAYPEFGDAPKHCRFAGCRHISEPDCAVKALLAENRIAIGRYQRYMELSEETEQRRKHQYD